MTVAQTSTPAAADLSSAALEQEAAEAMAADGDAGLARVLLRHQQRATKRAELLHTSNALRAVAVLLGSYAVFGLDRGHVCLCIPALAVAWLMRRVALKMLPDAAPKPKPRSGWCCRSKPSPETVQQRTKLHAALHDAAIAAAERRRQRQAKLVACVRAATQKFRDRAAGVWARVQPRVAVAKRRLEAWVHRMTRRTPEPASPWTRYAPDGSIDTQATGQATLAALVEALQVAMATVPQHAHTPEGTAATAPPPAAADACTPQDAVATKAARKQEVPTAASESTAKQKTQ